MNFKEYSYKRPDYKAYKKEFNDILEEFKNSNDFSKCNEKFIEINNLRKKVLTMETLAAIRYDINNKDDFYIEEAKYWNNNSPLYQEFDNNYFKLLLNSKFREEFELKYGKQLFKVLDFKLKSFSPEIIEEIKIENRLIYEYSDLLTNAKIKFGDNEFTFSELNKYKQSKDRQIRKEANEAAYNFFRDNEKEFNRIYDEIVKIRDKMAKKLGYKNYVELGYIRRSRTDFDSQMVEIFRQQVKDYMVPLIEKLIEKQKQRLNVEKIMYYDDKIEFLSGNAQLKSDNKRAIENLTEIYSELSPKLSSLFKEMINNGLVDLEISDNKALSSHCEYLFDYETPFIFTNFGGTASEINEIVHETGHAVQAYFSKNVPMVDFIWPTYEAAEIYSMGMELLVWPWLEKLFLEGANIYKFTNLSSALKLVPYVVTVDSFQHYVYENPNVTPEDRKKAWREIEKKYQPYRDYGDNEFLDGGGYWYGIRHIFLVPFYFIDYALAQVCAFQIWKKFNENKEECLEKYFDICKVGGTKSFLEIVDLCNLKSPFEKDTLESVISYIENWLESINYMNI